MTQPSTTAIIQEVRGLIAQAKTLHSQAYHEYRIYVDVER